MNTWQLSALEAVVRQHDERVRREERVRVYAAIVRHVVLWLALWGLLKWNWYAWEMFCRAIDAHLHLTSWA